MTSSAQPSMGVIIERISNIQADLSEIKALLTSHIEAQTKFEQDTISGRLLNNEKMTAMQTMVGDHERRLMKLEDIIRRLAVTDAVLRWVAMILMGSVITLIWGILTDQVLLSFP